MAKLDPENWKSAKDVLDEKAAEAKRKREASAKTEDVNGDHGVELEQPKVIQDQENHKSKKRKLDPTSQSKDATQKPDNEQRKQKRAEKQEAKREKALKRQEVHQGKTNQKDDIKDQKKHGKPEQVKGLNLPESMMIDPESVNGAPEQDNWSTASSSGGVPDILSPPADSGSSSISSIPPSIDQPLKLQSTQPKQKPKAKTSTSHQQPAPISESVQIPSLQSEADREAARARLANRISSFRSARKADEPTTSKPRNRAELLDQRRKKEEAKREAKKEQRRKEREEASRKEDEEIARRFSPGGSGSLLASPRSPPTRDGDGNANNFSYGRIEFEDGSKVDSTNLAGILDQRKRKGPQDTQTALKAAQNKASRLAGLDEQKRKEIAEKDMWLNAKRRAHGERVKDDTSLLKKALKRQEGQKKKSENEWTERKEGVQKAQEMKQKKRTDNLAKRKEDKLAHKVGKKGKKVKKRPGFEGSFRGRTGGGKKK